MIDFEYESLFKEGGIEKNYRIKVYNGSSLVTVITDNDLYSEEFEVYRPLCTEKVLRYGCCESAYVKFKVINTVVSLKNMKLVIYEQLGDFEDELKLGEFYVDTDELSDDRKSREIRAYDILNKIIKADVSKWYSELEFPILLRNFRNSFFTYFGVRQESISLCNDSMVVTQTVLPDLTGLDVLEAICSGNGTLGCINNEGNFKYVILSDSDTKNYEYYKQGTLVYEDYVVKKITKLTFYSVNEGKDIDVSVGSDGNEYIMQDNFLFYDKDKNTLLTYVTNIFNIIKETPEFRPLKAETYGDPCVEVGDWITFVNNEDVTIGTFSLLKTTKGLKALTDKFEIKGTEYFEYDLNSESSNIRRLWNNTKTLITEVNGARTYVYAQRNSTSFVGNKKITSSEWTTIINIPIATVDVTIPVFLATIPLIMSEDGEIHFTYFIDGIQIEGDEDVIYLTKGKQFVTISTFFECEKDRQYRFVVKAKAGYRESENRKQDAKIISLKDWIDNQTITVSGNTATFDYDYVEHPVDTTPPTIEIEQYKIRAMIFASGLASEAPWDGTLLITEEVSDFNLIKLAFNNIVDNVSVNKLTPTPITISDNISDFNLVNLIFDSVEDIVHITLHSDSKQLNDEEGNIIVSEDDIVIYTEGD